MPERQLFNPSNYKQPFLNVMNDFHRVMTNHYGRRDTITCRKYTVEMPYFFPPLPDGTASQDVKIVLNLSHNKDGVFTKHHFQGEGDKPFHYMTLKEDIDKIGSSHSSKAAKQYAKRNSRPDDVNVFDEVRQVLETMGCVNVAVTYLRCGVKFVGEHHRVKFVFIVYTKKDERLNTRNEKRVSVWEKPESPPVDLKLKVDQVISWVKAGEAGRLTAAEIAAGPSRGNNLEDLVVGMMKLNLKKEGHWEIV
jgi:hypothetical protein